MKNFLISFVLSILLLPSFASADTIVLKNGRRIENVRVWREDGQIKCYRFGSLIGYLKENVQRIEEEELNEKLNEANLFENKERLDLEKFKVIKVYDGDTFMAEGHNIKIMVRLIGIDTPEKANKKKQKPGQPYSQKAGEYLAKMILNKMVKIKSYGIGSYNRLLAEVFVDNKNVNLELLGSGFAEVYNGKLSKNFDIAPYRKAEMKARESQKGIWSLGSKYISPKKWRSMYNK